MTNPTIKRHWTTEHYPSAVPLDLWELIRALTYQMNLMNGEPPEKRLTPESFQEKVNYYTQTGTKLDAYRSYSDKPCKFCMTVGIRCSDEDSDYISPHLTWEVASKFDLDPLNKD